MMAHRVGGADVLTGGRRQTAATVFCVASTEAVGNLPWVEGVLARECAVPPLLTRVPLVALPQAFKRVLTSLALQCPRIIAPKGFNLGGRRFNLVRGCHGDSVLGRLHK